MVRKPSLFLVEVLYGARFEFPSRISTPPVAGSCVEALALSRFPCVSFFYLARPSNVLLRRGAAFCYVTPRRLVEERKLGVLYVSDYKNITRAHVGRRRYTQLGNPVR